MRFTWVALKKWAEKTLPSPGVKLQYVLVYMAMNGAVFIWP